MADYRSFTAPTNGNIFSPDAIKKLRMLQNDTLLDFLAIDLGIGLTMAQTAARAEIGSDSRARNTRNARRAYDTIVRFRANAVATDRQGEELDQKTSELRVALLNLGECV
ncbi:MAG TPA: hypothetical protein VFJ47_05365 [Terriglobales bacterium]|nr:hypothetical protein [Terriglobales bacterium]